MSYIPFFTEDDNLTALKKMKVLFLIKKIRLTDISIFLVWIAPFIINFIYFALILGKNRASEIFSTFGSLFTGSPSSSDWSTWYGTLHICAMILTVLLRIVLGVNLYKKMKKYKREHSTFNWDKKSRYWWLVFFPFVSFVIYPTLLRLTKFELVHKYNL
ncbi:hypothetical protein MHSWG343_09860 [Candidatus Mycoplasma haematohominis]|uniref:Uncharacterized protein n=1 Tax=Candidatus Mycoplasma haematohominis TaxID=1494318 RepID=A0A478FU66_9MOLU|nr:hypothetical protein MHSWG343_09860 [Candidatus Mycoplasma haemohominis]